MASRIKQYLGGALLLFFSAVIAAADLAGVYQQALTKDPMFKQAQATWLVSKQTLSLAFTGNGVVGTGLFPNITGTMELARNRGVIDSANIGGASSTGPMYYNSTDYVLNITQPVFNFATWLQIASAHYRVRAATATYLFAGQSLIQRVAVAYFEVLRQYELLQYAIAAKAAMKSEYETAQQKYKVGLEAVTGMYNAKASDDLAYAAVIKQRNALQDAMENLREQSLSLMLRVR